MSLVTMSEVILRKKAWKRSQNRHLTTATPLAALTLVCPIVISTSACKECKSVGASSWMGERAFSLKTIPLCVGIFCERIGFLGFSKFRIPPSLLSVASRCSQQSLAPPPRPPRNGNGPGMQFYSPYVYIDLHRVARYIL